MEDVAGISQTLLGPIIQGLLEKLVSREVLNYARREGIDTQLKNLAQKLPEIGAVLGDAEMKQMTNDGVKKWVDELSDLAYDLDDLLDDFATQEALLMTESEASTGNKVRNLIPTTSAVLKMEEINVRLQYIETQMNCLDLKPIDVEIESTIVTERLQTSCSLVDNCRVYGRENDKEAILELLLRDEASVSVIPIVGMGGIGKTTLAQLVYDDERLVGRFDPKMWICASDDFDAFRVTKTVLEELTSKSHDYVGLNTLQEELKKNLSVKRFLLVVDGVWNEKNKEWEVLQSPFMGGAPGSKIIVTTRHGKVASTMSLSTAYSLKELSKDECLSLFAHHALGRGSFDAHPDLKGIGEEIVNKCKGLPLAAKTLGGLLRNELQKGVWENVLNSKIWDLPEQRSGILPALRLSYHYLPSHLKQCFAYCALFPKGYEFDKEELVLLWMGAGLLHLSKGKKRMEDFGVECFDDLFSRIFFQESAASKSRFVMHDLLNDLAQHVAGDICFRLGKLEGNEQSEILERARYLSYFRQRFEHVQNFRPLCKVQHLRTLLPLPIQMKPLRISHLPKWSDFYLANSVLLDLLPKLQCLRVLSLSGYSITKLPDSIGDLKHLRYLNLSKTSIRELPESVSTLYNLQTLLLHNCNDLCVLPPSIGNLINLRHLDVTDTVQLREMSSGIGRLTNLQTLSKFVVSNGLGLKELRNLRLLRGSVSIVELQNVKDLQEAKEANLGAKEDLDELELAWCNDFDDFRNENLEMDVLDMLQPHGNLKSLMFKFYGGTKFPSWIENPSFSQIVNMTIVGCRKCSSLPPLGQLCMLKNLCIQGMHEVKKLGVEFCRGHYCLGFPFPSLETLLFEDMPAWEEWSCSTGVEEAATQFPCLHELTIRKCPKLIRVSILRLPSLQKLDLRECHEVVLKSIGDLTSLTILEVASIIGLSHLEEAFMQFLVALEILVFKECNQLVALWQNWVTWQTLVRLQRLHVESCPELVSFGKEDQGLPCNLKELYVDGCVNFEKLPNGLNSHTSLTSLDIVWCPKFVCFPKTGVSPTLRRLRMVGCEALRSLPYGISGLEVLEIKNCSSLRSWPTNTLPNTLKVLEISVCANLESVSDAVLQDFSIMSSLERMTISEWPNIGMFLGYPNNFASLCELEIYCCDLDSLERGLPTPNLKKLILESCDNVRSLLTNQIQSLEYLQIIHCPSFQSFPEKGLSTPNLRVFSISCCDNLRSLPFDQIKSLESLESIDIYDCDSLESFPQGNLPPNLIELFITGCGKVKPLSEWGLHRLTSLQKLDLCAVYPELVTFPDDHDNCFLLPPTLTELRLGNLPNLESVSSKGLQNLSSLRHLGISACPKLRSLPEEGLPSMLRSFQFRDCPLLEQRCLEDGGDYWPKIADIPCVLIDIPYYVISDFN